MDFMSPTYGKVTIESLTRQIQAYLLEEPECLLSNHNSHRFTNQ